MAWNPNANFRKAEREILRYGKGGKYNQLLNSKNAIVQAVQKNQGYTVQASDTVADVQNAGAIIPDQGITPGMVLRVGTTGGKIGAAAPAPVQSRLGGKGEGGVYNPAGVQAAGSGVLGGRPSISGTTGKNENIGAQIGRTVAQAASGIFPGVTQTTGTLGRNAIANPAIANRNASLGLTGSLAASNPRQTAQLGLGLTGQFPGQTAAAGLGGVVGSFGMTQGQAAQRISRGISAVGQALSTPNQVNPANTRPSGAINQGATRNVEGVVSNTQARSAAEGRANFPVAQVNFNRQFGTLLSMAQQYEFMGIDIATVLSQEDLNLLQSYGMYDPNSQKMSGGGGGGGYGGGGGGKGGGKGGGATDARSIFSGNAGYSGLINWRL